MFLINLSKVEISFKPKRCLNARMHFSFIIFDTYIEFIEPVFDVFISALFGIVVWVVRVCYLTDVLDIVTLQVPLLHVKCLVAGKEALKHLSTDQASLFVLVFAVKLETLTCAHVSSIWAVDDLDFV